MLIMKGIDSVFEKDDTEKQYTEKARFYQDILIFASTLREDEPFKVWDLAKFLLKNNAELRNQYHNSGLRESTIIERI